MLANAKNASRLLVAARVHAPRAPNTIARGSHQKGEQQEKKLTAHTADKKAVL